jgi:head-tail adaptor
MALAAGDLDRRVALQMPDLVDNGRGGRTPNTATGGWATIARPWAQLVPLRGEEAVRNLVERHTQLWRVTIRMRPGVTTAHRLLFGSIRMTIQSIAANADGDALVMTCESGGPA